MPYCENCSSEIDKDSKFCPECGTPNSIITESKETTPISEEPAFQTRKSNNGPYGSYRLEDLPKGFIIDDRYEVREKLGQGGFGAVYRTYDRKMAVDKALKVIPDSVAADREAMNELHNEARIMVSLNNENIVRVYDVHDTGSIKYIDMEYVNGKPLNEIKLESENKKLPEDRIKELGLQIAKGLAYAHTNRVIHKDIKPQNIMVNGDGVVKIMDFGISESVRTSMSRLAPSSSSGTLVYMSPEQIRGEDIGKESDIYSFGAMVYELLSGHPPFYKGAVEYQIFNETPKPLEDVSDKMNSMILKCLERDQQNRFTNFGDIITSLNGEKVKVESKEEVNSPAPLPFVLQNQIQETVHVKEQPKKKRRKAPLFFIIFIAIAFALSYFYFPLPFMVTNEYVELICELDPEKNTLLVEIENLVGFVIEAEMEESTIRGLERELKREPGSVPILSCLAMLNRELGWVDDEYQNLTVLKKNEVKGVTIPAVLTNLVERYENMTEVRLGYDTAVKNKDTEALGEIVLQVLDTDLLSKEDKKAYSRKHMQFSIEDCYNDGDLESLKKLDSDFTEMVNNGFWSLVEEEKEKKAMNSWLFDLGTALIEQYHFEDTRELLSVWVDLVHKEQTKIDTLSGKLKIHEEAEIERKVNNAYSKRDWREGLQLLEKAEELSYFDTEYILEQKNEGYTIKKEEIAYAETVAAERAEQARRKAVELVKENMAYVREGSFTMGKSGGWFLKDSNYPTVTVSSFYMGKYEITQAVWEGIMGSNPSHTKKGIGDNYPVNSISWYDAVEFCNRLSELAGYEKVYNIDGDSVMFFQTRNGYRLPTEAEWEFACRGFQDLVYSGSSSWDDVAWIEENSGDKSHPVGTKRNNGISIYDMSGNIKEWCWDYYAPYSSRQLSNPVGPTLGDTRILRGGSFSNSESVSLVINRHGQDPSKSFFNVGFRIARNSN